MGLLVKLCPAEAHIIRLLWEDAVTNINFEGSHISSYTTFFGLRQGAPSSPTIFNLMMKDIMKRLRYYGHGVQIGQQRVPGAAFADDSWLAANSWTEVQEAYYTMKEGLNYFGLEANPQKSYCW